MLDQLPNSILCDIVNPLSSRDFLNVCLVCKSLASWGQSVLFSSIIIGYHVDPSGSPFIILEEPTDIAETHGEWVREAWLTQYLGTPNPLTRKCYDNMLIHYWQLSNIHGYFKELVQHQSNMMQLKHSKEWLLLTLLKPAMKMRTFSVISNPSAIASLKRVLEGNPKLLRLIKNLIFEEFEGAIPSERPEGSRNLKGMYRNYRRYFMPGPGLRIVKIFIFFLYLIFRLSVVKFHFEVQRARRQLKVLNTFCFNSGPSWIFGDLPNCRYLKLTLRLLSDSHQSSIPRFESVEVLELCSSRIRYHYNRYSSTQRYTPNYEDGGYRNYSGSLQQETARFVNGFKAIADSFPNIHTLYFNGIEGYNYYFDQLISTDNFSQDQCDIIERVVNSMTLKFSKRDILKKLIHVNVNVTECHESPGATTYISFYKYLNMFNKSGRPFLTQNSVLYGWLDSDLVMVQYWRQLRTEVKEADALFS